MTRVVPFTESHKYTIYDSEYLQGYIYESVLDTKFYSLLKNHVSKIVDVSSTANYQTHGCTFKFNNKQVYIENKAAGREVNVILDSTFDPDYYYQTVDTIKDWSEEKIKKNVSPIFQHFYNQIQNLPPIAGHKNEWILYRSHINYLPTNKFVGLHWDGNHLLVNTIAAQDARILGLTFYLHDHIEQMGGEFWSVNGFVYKPKQNTGIMLLNGNRVLHGVTQNKNVRPRLAFTTRFLHKDDMFLPGHPDRCLYSVDGLKLDVN